MKNINILHFRPLDSGNTIPNPQMTRQTRSNKAFLLTVNEASLEYYQDIIEYLTGLTQFQYLLCTEHIGSANKHYHIYVQYNQSKYLSYSRLFGAHVETCFGSAQQNVDYCWARDKKHQEEGVTAELIDEIGEVKLKGGSWNVKTLKELDSPDELPAVYYNIYQKINNKEKSDKAFYDMLDSIENDSLRPIEVIYFMGQPGTGKTYNAYKYALRHFQKDEITKVTIQNNFFEFVGSCKDKCLVVEEFRPSQLHPSSLLQFIDKYGYSCPIKGGYKYVKPEMIIICSIIHPQRLYREDKIELNDQFTRRISKLFEVHNNHSYTQIFLNQVHIGGYPVGYRTDFNQLEEYEVTDDWDDTTVVIN